MTKSKKIHLLMICQSLCSVERELAFGLRKCIYNAKYARMNWKWSIQNKINSNTRISNLFFEASMLEKNRHHFLYKNDTHSISVHRESEYDSCQADQMINYNWQKLVASQHRTKSILHTAVDFDSLLFAKLNRMFVLLN